MKAELCKTCIHTKMCLHDKNLVGDTFVRGFSDLDDAWEKFKEWAKAGFPCDDYIPAADVAEVKHGRWEDVNKDATVYKCSVCGELSCCRMPFCGECGARMDEVEE